MAKQNTSPIITVDQLKRADQIVDDFKGHVKNHKEGTDFDSMIVSFFAVKIAQLEEQLNNRKFW